MTEPTHTSVTSNQASSARTSVVFCLLFTVCPDYMRSTGLLSSCGTVASVNLLVLILLAHAAVMRLEIKLSPDLNDVDIGRCSVLLG